MPDNQEPPSKELDDQKGGGLSDKWECYSDPSYFDKWAVRHTSKRAFTAAIHVGTPEEAEFLTEQLNKLDSLVMVNAILSGTVRCKEMGLSCYQSILQEKTEQLTATQQALDSAVEAKNEAYNERNQLVAALSKIFPSWLGMHDITDKTWDMEWSNIVYINALTGQLSWHLHDDDMKYFQHLKFDENVGWDGHSTEEKYRRLAALDSREE